MKFCIPLLFIIIFCVSCKKDPIEKYPADVTAIRLKGNWKLLSAIAYDYNKSGEVEVKEDLPIDAIIKLEFSTDGMYKVFVDNKLTTEDDYIIKWEKNKYYLKMEDSEPYMKIELPEKNVMIMTTELKYTENSEFDKRIVIENYTKENNH